MISILLATYNGEKYIKKSIDSIINQTYTDWELLIGFNGTTDGSKEVVAQYNDPRIKVFDYGDDKGKSKTLNKLMKEASGDWIALQDDDDIWLPKKLENQLEFINDFDIIGTQIFYIDEEENMIGKPNFSLTQEGILEKTLNGDNQIANSSAVIRKKFIIEAKGWDESLGCLEDFDLWLKLINLKCKFKNLKKEFLLHRIHKSSNFNSIENDIQENTKQNLIRKYVN